MFYLSTGVFALYPCNNSVGRQDVLTKLEINTYTPDTEYEPIVLYIPKPGMRHHHKVIIYVGAN